jgi:hypothetical protein
MHETAPGHTAHDDYAGHAAELGMGRYVLAVHSNAVAGREDEYNDWYSNRHLDDLRALPGVTAARRMKLADRQLRGRPQPFKYLALYEIETDDVNAVIDELFARVGTDRMPRSDALADDVSAVLWEVL